MEAIQTPMPSPEALYDADVTRLCRLMPGSWDAHAEWLDSLSQRDRHLIVLQGFHGQVCNGGFEQWVENGYQASEGHVALLALTRLEQHAQRPELARSARELLEACAAAVAEHGVDHHGRLSDEGHDALYPLADRYYAFSDGLATEIWGYFAHWAG